VVRAVLVAHDGHGRDLAGGGLAALLVGLTEHGVEALEDHLGDRGRLAHPDRGGQHQDVGVEHLGADGRPLVAVTLVGGDPELDVVVDRADHLALDAVLLERVEHLGAEQLAAGVGGRRLERADQDESA
jgi:hypothetical protein